MNSGAKTWSEKHPSAALALREIAEAHAQQDPSFRTSIAYTRLTAAEAISQLRSQGFNEEQIPAPSTMAVILNRIRKNISLVESWIKIVGNYTSTLVVPTKPVTLW